MLEHWLIYVDDLASPEPLTLFQNRVTVRVDSTSP